MTPVRIVKSNARRSEFLELGAGSAVVFRPERAKFYGVFGFDGGGCVCVCDEFFNFPGSVGLGL